MNSQYSARGGSIMLKKYSDNQTFLDDIRQEFITKTKMNLEEKIDTKMMVPMEKKRTKLRHIKSLFFLSEDSYKQIIRMINTDTDVKQSTLTSEIEKNEGFQISESDNLENIFDQKYNSETSFTDNSIQNLQFLRSELDHINSNYEDNTLHNINQIRDIIYKYNRTLMKYELTKNILMFSEFLLNHLTGPFTIEIYLKIIINVLIRIIDQSIKIYKWCVSNNTERQKYDFFNMLILFVSGLRLFIKHSKRELTKEKKQWYIKIIRQYIKYIDKHYKKYTELYEYIMSYVTDVISNIEKDECNSNLKLGEILDNLIHFFEIVKIYPKNLEDLIFNSTPLTILKRIQILLLNKFKNDVKSIDEYNYDYFYIKLDMIKKYITLKDDIKKIFNISLYSTFEPKVNCKIEEHIDIIIYQILDSEPENIFLHFFDLKLESKVRVLNAIIYQLFELKSKNSYESIEIKKLINALIQSIFSSLIPERVNEIKTLFGSFISDNPNYIYNLDDKQYIDVIIDGFICLINMILIKHNIPEKQQTSFIKEIIELYKHKKTLKTYDIHNLNDLNLLTVVTDEECIRDSNAIIKYLQDETKLNIQYTTDKKLKFYHFCESKDKLDYRYTTEFIEYYLFLLDDRPNIVEDLEKTLYEILKNTDDSIVIFIQCSSDSIFSKIKQIIEPINTPKKNIKIIYQVLNGLLENNPYFYKILGIRINISELIIPNDKNYVSETIKCIIITITQNQSNNRMLLIHWIIDLINTPSELEYRLLQLSGTCWLNVILNSLLLNKDLRNIIKTYVDDYWLRHTDKQPLKYHDFRDEEKVKDIKHLLFSLFSNYFNGEKPHTEKDILIFIASLIKSYSEPEDDYNILYQFTTKYRLRKSESPYVKIHNRYYLCKANDTNSLRQTFCSNQIINSSELDKLNDTCGYKKNNTSICDNFDKDTDEEKGFIYGNGGNVKYILESLSFIFSVKIFFDRIIILNIKDSQYYLYISTTDKDLIREGYTLCSSVIITADGTHVICGTIIDSKYYVYDSNGIWEIEDWTKLRLDRYMEMTKYKKKIIKQGFYLNQKTERSRYWHGKISYKIYIKKIELISSKIKTIV